MNKPVFYIIFIFVVSYLNAQENLVPNGSFEEYEWCPAGIADFSVSNWYSATWLTPDYFNICNNDFLSTGIPQNFVGYQHALDGNGYVGLAINFNFPPSVREYIQVRLKRTLTLNKIYEFSCYVSLADSISSICTSNLGFLFTSNTIGGDVYQIINETKYTNANPMKSCDKNDWNKIKFTFQANGEEEYLTIGVFDSEEMLDTSFIMYSTYGLQSYFYIDKVTLKEVDINIPNVFSPNNDGINDLLSLKGIPKGYEFIVLNRWGNVVFETNNPSVEFWDGTFKGELCVDGVYFYKITNEEFTTLKTGFIHLIR